MKWLHWASVTFFACGAVLFCLSLALVPQNGFAEDPGGGVEKGCSGDACSNEPTWPCKIYTKPCAFKDPYIRCARVIPGSDCSSCWCEDSPFSKYCRCFFHSP